MKRNIIHVVFAFGLSVVSFYNRFHNFRSVQHLYQILYFYIPLKNISNYMKWLSMTFFSNYYNDFELEELFLEKKVLKNSKINIR